jgi:hypothetical protein
MIQYFEFQFGHSIIQPTFKTNIGMVRFWRNFQSTCLLEIIPGTRERPRAPGMMSTERSLAKGRRVAVKIES